MKLFSLSLQQCLVRWSMVLIVVIASMALASQPAQASAPVENHCIAFGGIDLNEFYGVSEQLVAPGCGQIGSGEPYRVWAGWSMNSSFTAVPPEFVPAGDTPLEDFVAKFVAVKYVVDPGTAKEKMYIVPNRGDLWTGILFGLPHVNTLTLGVLKPLPVGQHRIDMYWIFSAMHCDGFSDVVAQSCLPAGETRFGAPGRPAFEVTADQR